MCGILYKIAYKKSPGAIYFECKKLKYRLGTMENDIENIKPVFSRFRSCYFIIEICLIK